MADTSPNVPNWTIAQREFIRWVATPTELREQRTLEEFGKRIHKDRKTLWRWKNLPGFWSEVKAATDQYMADSVPESLQVLKEMARRGSFPHLKMYLEMVGLYKPEQGINLKVGDLSKLSDDELRAIVEGKGTG